MNNQEIRKKIDNAQLILIGIGEKTELDHNSLEFLKKIISEKNYFIVSLLKDKDIRNYGIADENSVFPLFDDEEGHWKQYLSWLQKTLNHELLVFEFGVGFEYPEVIRFPFEKTVFYNKKAFLIRVNSKMYQLPEELKGKGEGINSDVSEFLNQLWNEG